MREKQRPSYAQGRATMVVVALVIGLFVFALTVLVSLHLPLEPP